MFVVEHPAIERPDAQKRPVDRPSAARVGAIARAGWRAVVAIALSAGLIALAAPGIGVYPWLAWIAFAPWLASLSRLTPRAASVSGLLMGMAYIVPGRWRTFDAGIANAGYRNVEGDLYTLAFFLSFALPFALFGALDGCLRWYARGSLQFLALLRAALLASLICAIWSPFPYTPASAIVDFEAMLQLAAIGGEPLLLSVLLWPSAVLAGVLTAPAVARSLRALLPLGLGLITIAGYGSWRIVTMDRAEAAGAGVRLSALPLQLDLPSLAAPALLIRDRVQGNLSALERSRSALQAAPQCELVVWPETPLASARLQQVCAAGQRMVDSLGRSLLMHCKRAHADGQQATAELRQPGHVEAMVHGKSKLVPLYERPLLGKGELLPGEPGEVFSFDAQRRLIPTLCYELHSRPHLRAGVLAGGNFVMHMASFSSFDGHPIDVWDQGLARLRAVEFGVPIVRASNRGSSGWIDAAGRPRAMSSRFGQQAECVSTWSPAASPTVYTHLAPIAAGLPILLVGLAGAVSRLRFQWPFFTRTNRSTQCKFSLPHND
jgi:apolipoprotein N-acyltransferase